MPDSIPLGGVQAVPMPRPPIFAAIGDLRQNCQRGKSRHFSAADRFRLYHVMTGVPIIVINVAIGSVLFKELGNELPSMTKWLGMLVSLAAAAFGAFQTFGDFHLKFKEHRRIANAYLAIATECKAQMASYESGLTDLRELREFLFDATARYTQINKTAEHYPANKRDHAYSLKVEKQKATPVEPRTPIGMSKAAIPEIEIKPVGIQPSKPSTGIAATI